MILDCVTKKHIGMDALMELIQWKEGKFEFKDLLKPLKITLGHPIEYVLLELTKES
jgi:hypothetical protein